MKAYNTSKVIASLIATLGFSSDAFSNDNRKLTTDLSIIGLVAEGKIKRISNDTMQLDTSALEELASKAGMDEDHFLQQLEQSLDIMIKLDEAHQVAVL